MQKLNLILFLALVFYLYSCANNRKELGEATDRKNILSEQELKEIFTVGYNALMYELILTKCPPPLPNTNQRIICPKSYVFWCDSVYLLDKSVININGQIDTIQIKEEMILSHKDVRTISRQVDEEGNFMFKDFKKCINGMDLITIVDNKMIISGGYSSLGSFKACFFYFQRDHDKAPWRLSKLDQGGAIIDY